MLSYLIPIVVGYVLLVLAFCAVVVVGGAIERRRLSRLRTSARVAAPVVELDLHRARRASARGGYIHHHNTPGGTAA